MIANTVDTANNTSKRGAKNEMRNNNNEGKRDVLRDKMDRHVLRTNLPEIFTSDEETLDMAFKWKVSGEALSDIQSRLGVLLEDAQRQHDELVQFQIEDDQQRQAEFESKRILINPSEKYREQQLIND